MTLIATTLVAAACETGSGAKVGDEALIYEEGLTSITVARDGDGWDDLTEAFVANDRAGIAALIASDRAFSVANGTPALVLDRDFTKTKIRITSGAHNGEIGYVPKEWVEKS